MGLTGRHLCAQRLCVEPQRCGEPPILDYQSLALDDEEVAVAGICSLTLLGETAQWHFEQLSDRARADERSDKNRSRTCVPPATQSAHTNP
jgi:hypothetical protein